MIYFGSSPDITKYAKGSRSWRTNNPGLVSFCLETRQQGAIGQVLGVAVFQDPEQGRRALQVMLGREELAGQTVAAVLRSYIPNYTPPPRETDPATGEPGPWTEPETGVDLELTMSGVGGGDRQALADLIERRIGYHPGVITHEPYDTGTFNTAKRNPGASPGNRLINGRSAVHKGSGGTVSSPDICETPSGKGCKSVMYTNIAKSVDSAQTATTVKVNGHPVCTLDSIFSTSTGDEGGRCGGIRSGTIKGQAKFVTASNNFMVEGQRAVRQFDQMTSNYQNTPFTPLMQPGGARPPFLNTVGAPGREAGPTPWRFDWRIAAGALKQLSGRWALISGPAFGERRILGRPITIGTRHQQGNGYWDTEMAAPLEGACGYALELPEANPTGDTPPSYFIPFDHLGLGKTRPYDAPPRGEEIAVPVVIGLYGSEARDSADLALPELGRDPRTEQLRQLSKDKDNQGWLYVYVDGHLWRELEVKGLDRGMRSYADVNLTTHQAQDVRPASVQTVNHLLLPHQVGGKPVKVEIAYARVQWSWERIVALGGLARNDPRVNLAANDAPPKDADQRRAQRMQRVDLSGHANGWPSQAGSKDQTGLQAIDNLLGQLTQGDAKEYLLPHAGGGIPVLMLDDPLAWVRNRAFDYQQSWRDMADYIAELANPDNRDKHPFAPWFDTAVLANRYFFAPLPDIDNPNLSKGEKKELVRAIEERLDWQGRLSLGDIQQALGTQHRAELRARIKTAKQQLVDLLDTPHPELSQLVAVLDDWQALPGQPQFNAKDVLDDQPPRYGDGYQILDQLITGLADHEYNLDWELETDPPDGQALYQLEQNDPGRVLLRKIANANGGHPLHERYFPKPQGEDPYEYADALPTDPSLFHIGKLGDAMAIGRRTSQFVYGFVEHFNSLTAKAIKAGELDALTRLLSAGVLQTKLHAHNVSIEEIIDRHLKENGLVRLGDIDIEWDEPIDAAAAKQIKAGGVKTSKGTTPRPIIVTDLSGATVLGSTTVDAFQKGTAFSTTEWEREAKNMDWRKTTIRMPVAHESDGLRVKGQAIAYKLKQLQLYNKVILPAIGLLEMWNLSAAINALTEKAGTKKANEAWLEFGGAVTDMASVVAMFREEIIKHRVVQQRAANLITQETAERILRGAARWAYGLGAVAGAYSARLSYRQMLINIHEGDDAAISHTVMMAGFVSITLAMAGGTLSTISVFSGTLIGEWAGIVVGGPWLWLGLGLVLLGNILLVKVFKENDPIDWWLKYGPFSKLADPNNRLLPQIDGTKLLAGPKGSAIKLDRNDNIVRVIPAPHGTYNKTSDGEVLVLENGNARSIGRIGEPVDPQFLMNYGDNYHDSRFNGHEPGTQPKDQYGRWYEHPQ
ncbi:PAAR-like domain-containing protein, partial [Sedimenticola sp.]|uniref:PAAR-like domain-containing protein n=1 Tax=Sedimenticola sp. TaxID=1940285 RepID=UPI003D10BFD0